MKPLARNFLAASGADAGSRFLGFLVTAYLARVLGPSSFGLMSIALSVLGYASLFAGPGLNVYGARYVASAGNSSFPVARQILVVRTLLGAVSACVFCAGALVLFGVSQDWLTLAVFVSAAIPMAATADWYLQGKNSIGRLAIARLTMYGAYLLLVVALVRSPADTVWSGVSFAAGTWVMAGVTLLFMFRSEHPVSRQSGGPQWAVLLKESLPLGLSAILAQTVANLPVLIVGAIMTTTEAGLFGSAMKLVFFALMLDRVFYLLFLPVASRTATSPEQLPPLVEMALKMVLSIAIPVTVLSIAFAGPLTVLVYGEHFAASAPVFAAAMPYFAFTVVSTVMMTTLYATHREKDFLTILAVGTLVLVVLCSALTVLAGTAGGALGLSLGELFMAVVLTRKVSSLVSIHVGKTVLAFLGAAGAMGVSLYVGRGFPPAAQAFGSATVFLGSVLLLKGITFRDIAFIREKLA
ncbi:MAG: oligosaccharide flippase family protein [Bacteroidota bacterium]